MLNSFVAYTHKHTEIKMGESFETPPEYENGIEAQVNNNNDRQRRFKIIRNIILTIICCVAVGFLFYFAVTVGFRYLAKMIFDAIVKIFEDSKIAKEKYTQEMLAKGCQKKCIGGGFGIMYDSCLKTEWVCE